MSIPQSVATILREHVRLALERSDRGYLNVYVPQLQRVRGGFFPQHRGAPFVSSVLLDSISKAFVTALER